MDQKHRYFITGILALFLLLGTWYVRTHASPIGQFTPIPDNAPVYPELPIFIDALRNRSYPESTIVVTSKLASGANYQRYVAYYLSDNLKIYGLFTIPNGTMPAGGWPAIVFLHGHLDPKTYTPTARYVAYQDGFARNGFITFKPDLRGHGQSDGDPVNASFSEGYVVDSLNLVAALKVYPDANAKRIGVWGHSMGGGIALRDMVISKDIKAGVIWAGVVGDYTDLLERYKTRAAWLTAQSQSPHTQDFYDKYGSPSANPAFWSLLDPYSFLNDISGPVQLHHTIADNNVPIEFSRHLNQALQRAGKTVEEYEYPGNDHNISASFNLAMQRSVAFFKKYL